MYQHCLTATSVLTTFRKFLITQAVDCWMYLREPFSLTFTYSSTCKHYAMLPQLLDMENMLTLSSDPQPTPAAPPSLSLPLSSSSTSSWTKKQKRTPTYQRSVSQERSDPVCLALCFKHGLWGPHGLVKVPVGLIYSFLISSLTLTFERPCCPKNVLKSKEALLALDLGGSEEFQILIFTESNSVVLV